MTNKEILQYAILKVSNKQADALKMGLTSEQIERYIKRGEFDGIIDHMLANGAYKALIFDHEFAKGIFTQEERIYHSPGDITGQWAWQYHLQQMILEENPLGYLERFL